MTVRGRIIVPLLAFCLCLGFRADAQADGCCHWAGIYPTVVTPWCDHSGIDVGSLEHQIRHELGGGVHGLLVLGTIGEGQYASLEERAQVISTAVHMAGAAPVIVGIHTCDLNCARTQLCQARDLGAAAVLVKYVGRPRASAPEVLGFFSDLSQDNVLPIFYYHYPSQTGLKLAPRDIADILSLPGIAGIKESTLNLKEVQEHIRLSCGLGKAFFSGTALNLTQFLALGGCGAMCPEAVLLPGPTVQAYEAYVHGRCREARCLQAHLFEMTPILQSRPTPVPMTRALVMSGSDHKMPLPMGKDQPQARLKAALCCMGIPTSTSVKCPLPPLSARDERRVEKTMSKVKSIDWCAACYDMPPIPLSVFTSCERQDSGLLLGREPLMMGPGPARGPWQVTGDASIGW
jgi:dihydrodipicolinate synthase/N-acetylneuraminate lyase